MPSTDHSHLELKYGIKAKIPNELKQAAAANKASGSPGEGETKTVRTSLYNTLIS
jgi:hypothetical protein